MNSYNGILTELYDFRKKTQCLPLNLTIVKCHINHISLHVTLCVIFYAMLNVMLHFMLCCCMLCYVTLNDAVLLCYNIKLYNITYYITYYDSVVI